jgi:hypothetical protein
LPAAELASQLGMWLQHNAKPAPLWKVSWLNRASLLTMRQTMKAALGFTYCSQLRIVSDHVAQSVGLMCLMAYNGLETTQGSIDYNGWRDREAALS